MNMKLKKVLDDIQKTEEKIGKYDLNDFLSF